MRMLCKMPEVNVLFLISSTRTIADLSLLLPLLYSLISCCPPLGTTPRGTVSSARLRNCKTGKGTYSDVHKVSDIGLFDHLSVMPYLKSTGVDHGRNLDINNDHSERLTPATLGSILYPVTWCWAASLSKFPSTNLYGQF